MPPSLPPPTCVDASGVAPPAAQQLAGTPRPNVQLAALRAARHKPAVSATNAGAQHEAAGSAVRWGMEGGFFLKCDESHSSRSLLNSTEAPVVAHLATAMQNSCSGAAGSAQCSGVSLIVSTAPAATDPCQRCCLSESAAEPLPLPSVSCTGSSSPPRPWPWPSADGSLQRWTMLFSSVVVIQRPQVLRCKLVIAPDSCTLSTRWSLNLDEGIRICNEARAGHNVHRPHPFHPHQPLTHPPPLELSAPPAHPPTHACTHPPVERDAIVAPNADDAAATRPHHGVV